MREVLMICLSQKPGPDEPEKRSATRQLLRASASALEGRSVGYEFVDIRETPFPFFDGRQSHKHGEAVATVLEQIAASRFVVLSVPAYWGSMSGVAKNFFDVLGGAAYDELGPCELLSGKRVGAIVVGGAGGDASAAVEQLDGLVRRFGAAGLQAVVQLDDPRRHSDLEGVVRQCSQLPFQLAQSPRLRENPTARTDGA